MTLYTFQGTNDQGGDYSVDLTPSSQYETQLVDLITTFLLGVVDEGTLHIYKRYDVTEDITPVQ